MKLILFFRHLRDAKKNDELDQISVLGGVVVLIVDVECLKKCLAKVKVGF